MARMSRFIPLREYLGKDRQGRVVAKEVYGDPWTHEVYTPMSPDGEYLGWDGAPPNPRSGAPEREGTERQRRDRYRENWDRIFGQKEPSHGAEQDDVSG